MSNEQKIVIERSYSASIEELWDLWTTPTEIESWWAPDGFTVEVSKLDLKPGGKLLYSMTATAPAQIEFMQKAGMPLRTDSQKTYTQVVPGKRLAYMSLVDFVPDVEPYEHETVVEFEPSPDGVRTVMTLEPMHDEVWTQRLVMGRENELDNLARLIEARADS